MKFATTRTYGKENALPRSAASSSYPSLTTPHSPHPSERSGNEDQDEAFVKPKRRISFDERVSVREFESNSWGSLKDMEQLSPIGRIPRVIVCGRDAVADVDLYPSCPLFPGLEDGKGSSTVSLSYLLRKEIRTILMVDPHDIFITLFSKRLQESLPHGRILKAHSAEEALQLISKRNVDIIITEERLSLFHKHSNSKTLGSGSALLSHLRANYAPRMQRCLLIGVTAHWQSDHTTMEQSGADYCWSKAPPPTLQRSLLVEILHTLLLKRGQHDVAKELMMAGAGASEVRTDNQKQ